MWCFPAKKQRLQAVGCDSRVFESSTRHDWHTHTHIYIYIYTLCPFSLSLLDPGGLKAAVSKGKELLLEGDDAADTWPSTAYGIIMV